MKVWLTSLCDRPIAGSERATAMVTVTVLMVAAAILLTLSQPHGQSRQSSSLRSVPRIVQGTSASRVRISEESTTLLTSRVARAADLFLTGYLGYLYGHAPVAAIEGATPALLRSLRAQPARMSPGMLGRRPRVVALRSSPATAGLLGVSALVNDGGVVDYSIGLHLALHRGRLLVSALEPGE
jgi:hypothetical protein